jgi:DNA polymerase I-like protein with 3'-5' exonuclease and polymerase domains
VHDSVVIDIHPDEENIIISLIKSINNDLTGLINNAFSVKLNVPMLLEAKIGTNWLDTKDVA